MKNNRTRDPAIATVTIPVDASYSGKRIMLYYSDDDITRTKFGEQIAQADAR